MEKDILDEVIKAEKEIQKRIDIAEHESQEEIKKVKEELEEEIREERNRLKGLTEKEVEKARLDAGEKALEIINEADLRAKRLEEISDEALREIILKHLVRILP